MDTGYGADQNIYVAGLSLGYRKSTITHNIMSSKNINSASEADLTKAFRDLNIKNLDRVLESRSKQPVGTSALRKQSIMLAVPIDS